jgi:hypothetical protein
MEGIVWQPQYNQFPVSTLSQRPLKNTGSQSEAALDWSMIKYAIVHCKKMLSVFPSPTGMSLTKLSLPGNNLISPAQEEFG